MKSTDVTDNSPLLSACMSVYSGSRVSVKALLYRPHHVGCHNVTVTCCISTLYVLSQEK